MYKCLNTIFRLHLFGILFDLDAEWSYQSQRP